MTSTQKATHIIGIKLGVNSQVKKGFFFLRQTYSDIPSYYKHTHRRALGKAALRNARAPDPWAPIARG